MQTGTSVSKPFVLATYLLMLLGVTAMVAAIPFDIRLAILPGAIIFGWSQLGGL